ncbi:hypothetical protein D3C85_1079900 [compost metagenome]
MPLSGYGLKVVLAGKPAGNLALLTSKAGVDTFRQLPAGILTLNSCLFQRNLWVDPQSQHLLFATEAELEAPVFSGRSDQQEQALFIRQLLLFAIELGLSGSGIG